MLIPVLLVASALRADTLTQPVMEALTPLDALPSTTAIDAVFGTFGTDTATNLRTIALTPTTCSPPAATLDFGVQLRAIRALPAYCPIPCGVDTATTGSPDTLVHATLVELLDAFNTIPVPTPCDLLRGRATIEALGLAGVSAAIDTDRTLLEGFLNNASRDVRATTAKAIGTLCNRHADSALLKRFVAEPTAQVRLAISVALRALDNCPGAM